MKVISSGIINGVIQPQYGGQGTQFNEHIINLLLEVRGNLQTDKGQMLSVIERYLQLPPDEKLLFTIGRRLNIFFLMDDLKKPTLHRQAEESIQKILRENPDIDFTVLCNYVRQSQI